ncbi:MAG: PIN domain nuclease [Vulcanimicrobiota bacterium]
MILIDTSVWIDFFNGREALSVRWLKELIEREEDICLSDLILTEILQGFRHDKDFVSARRHLLRFPTFGLKGIESSISAAQIYRACRKNGLTIRSTVDCIIAQTAIENRLILLHHDNDFETIASVCALKIYRGC